MRIGGMENVFCCTIAVMARCRSTVLQSTELARLRRCLSRRITARLETILAKSPFFSVGVEVGCTWSALFCPW